MLRWIRDGFCNGSVQQIEQMMAESLIETLALLRAAVGYLGERDQQSWWQSGFFSSGSRAFLTPVFGRTQVLAQCAGVTRAAALVHDERIGVGQVYHLFRCPEDLEQGIHAVYQRSDIGRYIGTLVTSPDAALALLREQANSTQIAGIGPTRVGDESELRKPRAWRTVAAHYARAFAEEDEVFPYFTGRP
jgi:hypothetical protein